MPKIYIIIQGQNKTEVTWKSITHNVILVVRYFVRFFGSFSQDSFWKVNEICSMLIAVSVQLVNRQVLIHLLYVLAEVQLTTALFIKKKMITLGNSTITRRTFTHLRLSLTSDVEDTVPEVAVVMVVVVAVAFTTDGATGTVTAVGTLSFSFSVLSSAHKRFEVLSHHKQQHKKEKRKR